MRLLYILLFSVSLFAGEWTINDFTIRGKQFTQSATGILQGNLNRIPSYRAPKGDELLLRRRLDMNNYGLYIGKIDSLAHKTLSRFAIPAGMDVERFHKVKFYKTDAPSGYNDIADVYFHGNLIYVQNVVRIFYKINGRWYSLENHQINKNEKFRIYYDVTPAEFSLFVNSGPALSELSNGLHHFRFSAPGYTFLDTSIVIVSDTTIKCALAPTETEVKILVKNSSNRMLLGGVEVIINGTSYGKNPHSIKLKSGKHHLTLVKNGFKKVTTTFKVGSLPLEKVFELSPNLPADDPDKDGVYGTSDRCPDHAEDKDGFQDDDGCPDYDNDYDGILDTKDKCPNRPEVYNAYKDEDGCPDKKPVRNTSVKTIPNVLILKGVSFHSGKASLTSASFSYLDEIVEGMKVVADATFRVEGHTDSVGSVSSNQRLSAQRAKAVRDYIVSKGIKADRITAVGKGETEPIASNSTADGRAKNRRIELHRLEK